MNPNQYREVRLEKLGKLKALGLDVWPRKAERTHGISEIIEVYGGYDGPALEEHPRTVSVMGRIVAYRDSGKTAFLNIGEAGQKLQVYMRKDALSETDWEVVRLLDMGDFISVTGTLMRTKTGELTVRASRVQFLSKALLPLPEKWHGLQDKELRYRQRYLDLISNPEVIQTFVLRSKILAGIRHYMEHMAYLEVETPMMQPIPGGATARPFITHHNALDMPLYLRVAPELYLKRLIVGGFHKVFEINRNFRNEGLSARHNPEFTMLESYAAGDDLRDVMVLTENMFAEMAILCGGLDRPFGDHIISYATPFRRLSLKDAIAEFGQIDRERLERTDDIVHLAKEAHLEDIEKKGPGVLLGELFEHHVEKQLIQPTFITDYPIELSPLTKTLPGNDMFVDRFELFIGGMELANAYSELNDPVDQLGRFMSQMSERESGNDEAMMLDLDFVNALEHGFPPTGGLGVGIDRMVMLMTNAASIRDVILFPLMRPQTEKPGMENDGHEDE